MCDATNPMVGVAPNLVKFINYETDRDLLGNPRWLKNVSNEGTDKYIDRGAFETWKVEKNFVCGKWTNNEVTYGTNKELPEAIVHHFYPHDGSVVYVMEGKTLVIDPVGPGEIKPTPENPGFLLVKEGASFYGNGRPVTAAYVAVERTVRKAGNIVAVPYKMNFNNAEAVAKVGTVTNDGHADLSLDKRNSSAFKYSGNERMDWKYIFQTTDTKCWDQISESAANQGVLFQPYSGTEWYADETKPALLRFTGKGNGIADYIYTENGVSKVVTLTKNDDAESTNYGADYTDEKDMGWNCFGLPYLVSEYKPYETATAYGSDKYMMYNPHTLWLYFDGTQTPDKTAHDPSPMGDGGYYSVKSWDASDHWYMAPTKEAEGDNPAVYADPAIWVGEGIFTQTATLDDTEALTFYLPVAPISIANTAKTSTHRYYFGEADGIVEAELDNVELVATEYYTTDGIRIDRPRRGMVTIIRRLYSNGAAQTSKQFVK